MKAPVKGPASPSVGGMKAGRGPGKPGIAVKGPVKPMGTVAHKRPGKSSMKVKSPAM